METRILLFTGNGGAGKATCVAATALRAAEMGYRTLVLSSDPAHSLADALDRPLGPEPQEVLTRLPIVDGAEAAAQQFGDPLVIQLGNQRRNYSLPKFLAYYDLAETRYADGWLRVRFVPAAE